MKKTQILILMALLALVIYYFQEKGEQKPTSKNTIAPKPTKQPVIVSRPSSLPISLKKPFIPTQSPWSLDEINEPKTPILHTPIKIKSNSDEKYRQQLLGLLEDWRESFTNLAQKSKVTETISLLQASNKARSEYLQSIWSLSGMEGFEFYCGQSFREWVNLPIEAKPAEEPIDYGWLTDDNLEFILENHEGIQHALSQRNQVSKQFCLRTDLANVYNCYYKAKSKQEWDLADFCQELEWSKAQYTLLPLRVNGNHWGLVILHEYEKEPEAKPIKYEPNTVYLPEAEEVELRREVYYTSSGGEDLESEKEQLRPFIEQVCGAGEIKVIEPKDRESKGYECGVYLVFYVLEILENGVLELKRQHTEADCQNFRWEWKERIGEKWCWWD